MEPPIPLPLDEQVLNEAVARSKDFAVLNGLAMRTRVDQLDYAPHSLIPSPVPSTLFQQAVNVQKDINLLIHRVAEDREFLRSSLERTIEVDDYTKKLFHIYTTVGNEGVAQKISLGLLRADYMFDSTLKRSVGEDGKRPNLMQLKQIEINTIASSFAGLSCATSQLHRATLEALGFSVDSKTLPENNSIDGLAAGMLAAWNCYGQPKAVILFVVENVNQLNAYDQRWLEYKVGRLNPNCRVIRKKMSEITERASLTQDKKMLIDGHEVALIYFRYGYMPNHYSTEKDWEARLLMERSLAIKCPSIHYHLAGTKKVQQVLSEPGVVERFIPDPPAAKRIRDTFAGQYSIELGPKGDESVSIALSNPENYVMKPQLEGGGNNLFDQEIVKTLEDINGTSARSAYILMDRIRPAVVKNYPLKPHSGPAIVQLQEMVSELGIYGVVIGSGGNIILNTVAGHLLRTKSISENEGGVATGSSLLDSPYLV